MTLRIGIVAAEPSGDLLGAGLMAAIRARRPDVRFEGIGGERMTAQGLTSRVPMEKLSVMGLVEVLKHLPELLGIRRDLARHWLANPPQLYIGVDAPDFNLGLERRLKAAGITTVHYVCPTVWAWRPKRVNTLRKATNLVLSIFPFEKDFLDAHRVHSRYVGHPLAHEMPLQPDRAVAREALGLAPQGPVLAILPGSRRSEICALSRPFLQAAARLQAEMPDLQLVVPLVNERSLAFFESQRAEHTPQLQLTTVLGRSREALAAADLALTASGTATLEGLLSKRPMVVGYKVHWLTYAIARLFRLIKVEHIAMANLLAGERLAPELVQGDCEPEHLADALRAMLADPARIAAIGQRYREIHESMIRDTNAEAAEAVLALLPPGGGGHG
jgi:lipid-A-disaccharide synthase